MQLFRGSKILNFGLHDFMFVCVGLGGGGGIYIRI